MKFARAAVRPARWSALRHGVAVEEYHVRLLARLKPLYVLDVGGNRGQFALAVRLGAPDAHVISFEPLVEASERFRKVLGPDPRNELRTVALGSSRGTALINVSAKDDSSSLLDISAVQTTTFRGTDRAEVRSVVVSTLDDEIHTLPNRCLLKLDVQGYELEVLVGGDRTISQATWILCEVSFLEFYAAQPTAHQVIEHLFKRGYHLRSVEHVTFVRRRPVQADLLFVNSVVEDADGTAQP
jgi:FkbM family methyltransferase